MPRSRDVEIVSTEGTRTIAAWRGRSSPSAAATDSTVMLKHDDVSRRHASVEVTASRAWWCAICRPTARSSTGGA